MAAGHWWEQMVMQATSPEEEKLKPKGRHLHYQGTDLYIPTHTQTQPHFDAGLAFGLEQSIAVCCIYCLFSYTHPGLCLSCTFSKM